LTFGASAPALEREKGSGSKTMKKSKALCIQDLQGVKVEHGMVLNSAPIMAERRVSPRAENNFNAAYILKTLSYNVEIVDLSKEGARIYVRQGLMPPDNATVSLCFMDGAANEATVVWTSGFECGLKFSEPLTELEEKRHFDEMGADFFHSILRFNIEK
jgi:PilZ domain